MSDIHVIEDIVASVGMKSASFVSFLVISITLAQGLTDSLISTPEDAIRENGRIIDGWPAAINQFPHQVHLRMVTPTGGLNACGGSLIHPRWVLTAAHCLVQKTLVIVRLGGVNVTTPGLILESRDFFIHPGYNTSTLNNDLGLINLGRTVQSSDNIRPIRLPGKDALNQTFAGEVATVSGWGLTANNGSTSETLNFVNLSIITNARCLESYPANIINSTICAVGIQNTTQSTCNGDSGGPLIFYGEDGEPTLIGVVSFVSSRGCDSGNPSGYVRPQFFLDWINEAIES